MLKRIGYIALALVLFISCRSTKESVKEISSVETQKDSTYIINTKTVVPGFTKVTIVEELCDSLGNLKPIDKTVSTPAGSGSLKSRNGKLFWEIDIPPLELNDTYKYEYKNINKDNSSSFKEKIKVYVWTKYTYIFLGIAILEGIAIFFLIQGSILTSPINKFKNLLK